MNRSVPHELFGFLFQVNSAIALMLDYIVPLKSLRLEGEEDIELLLEDDSYVLSQAKSIVNASSDFRNVRRKLKDALGSLSEASNKVSSARQLVYITNSSNPFNEDNSRARFYGANRVRYKELPSEAKAIIDKYLKDIVNPLDPSMLVVQRLPYESDDSDERNRYIIDKIGDFLGEKLDIHIDGLRVKLHKIWQESVFMNGSTQNNKKLTKEDLLWPLIVCIIDMPHKSDDSIYDSGDSGLDENDVEELVVKYKTIIDSKCERFEFVTKVISDYTRLRNNESNPIQFFVENHWDLYSDDFDADVIDRTIRPSLIKVVISNVLNNRRKIDSVKKYCKL